MTQEILNAAQIEQKINRLAYQILENTFEESAINIGGIQGNGYHLAERLAAIIQLHGKVKTEVFEIQINKDEPWAAPVTLSIDKDQLKNSFIILVDDVLNSGKTMQYALIEFLRFPTKAIRTVTLVDRTHRRFPIRADYAGLSLSTTLREHVHVDLTPGKEKAFLS